MEKRIKNSAKKDPVDSIPNIDTSWKNSLGFQLGKALWALSATLNATLKENGIDLPTSQYIVMRFLYGQDGISQNRIATLLYKDAAAIKRSIDNLEKKGLVERRAVSRCKNNIYLTEKGRKEKARLEQQENTSIFSCLDETEKQEFRRLLEKMSAFQKHNSKSVSQ